MLILTIELICRSCRLKGKKQPKESPWPPHHPVLRERQSTHHFQFLQRPVDLSTYSVKTNISSKFWWNHSCCNSSLDRGSVSNVLVDQPLRDSPPKEKDQETTEEPAPTPVHNTEETNNDMQREQMQEVRGEVRANSLESFYIPAYQFLEWIIVCPLA